MKKICLLFALTLLFNSAFSQPMSGFLKSNDLVWYGIDFSKAKMVGPDFNDPTAIVERYFTSWNELFISEHEKYSPEKYFCKANVTISFEEVTKRNKMVDPTKIVVPSTQQVALGKSDIEQIVKEFDFGSHTGYGALMIVEKFNKLEEHAYIYVVIIDLNNKAILKSALIKGKARGFGFRNYWAGAIYDVLKECKNEFATKSN